MLTFAIDRNNRITVLPATRPARVNPVDARFSNTGNLDRLAERRPGPRLVEIWNALPGQKPVKKFTNRKVAISRIWAAAQRLAPNQATARLHLVPQKGKKGKPASPPKKSLKRGKTGRVLELLHRPSGVTLKQLISATQWQAHSVRGFLSGALKKKMGLKIESTKKAGRVRIYSIKA